MVTAEIDQKGMPIKIRDQEYGLSLLKILSLMLSKWYYFLIALAIATFLARFYINHTLQVFKVSAKILINESEENATPGDQLLQGFGLPVGVQNLDNQMAIISSRTVIGRAIDELPFNFEYYYKTLRNRLPIYPAVPFKIVPLQGDTLPEDVEFSFIYLGNDKFLIETLTKEAHKIEKEASFGEIITYPGGNFYIANTNPEWLIKNKEKKMSFIIPSRMSLIKSYMERLKVEAISEEGTVVKISIEGSNRKKDADFLNALAEVFTAISLDKKNTEADRRIQFINNQLIGITDSLVMTENRLQQFRSRNRVMNLSAQGEVIIDQAMSLENEKARIAIENNYYKYLAEYLAKENTSDAPVAPATAGILDPGLTRLVAELAELQNQLYSRSLGEMNPLQNQLIQRIRNTRTALMETLNGLIEANNMAMTENLDQIRRINNQASTLPITERQLLGIERQFKLNDELYTFLLEKRAEQQIQKASNVPDNEMIDYADELDHTIVSPIKPAIYLLGWFSGLAFPFLIILTMYSLNKTVKEEEIKQIVDFPISGTIPRNNLKISTVVLDHPESSIAEAFRLLRSRMQFFIKETKSPVILVTSSLPEDGKTFTAINLASVYSILGKKTVLVGFDLRKPKIYEDFNLENSKGVSSWIIGKDTLKDITQKTNYENLFIITAGPIPPNPSELTSLPKTEELLTLLKKSFDYIIVDTSPIGVVSDTYHLASMADCCLLVVRQDKTLRDIFEKTVKEIRTSEIKDISLVINDVLMDEKRYGYGAKYGYTKAVNESKKNKKANAKKNVLARIKALRIMKRATIAKNNIPVNEWKSNIPNEQ